MQQTEGMTGRSKAVLFGCLLANVADGFDVLAIAFAGSAIMADWGLSPAVLGSLFSAGLAGMMLGSLFIAPLADRWGRRSVSLSCMAAMVLGMFAAWASQTVGQLILARLLTGLGIGGVLAALNTVVAEVAPPSRRNTLLAIFAAGYPIGSIVGGMLAIWLIADFGWRVVFLLGGVLTALVFAINYFVLPESFRPGGRVRLLSGAFFSQLFGPGQGGRTIVFCSAFFLNMIAFFFILNWTPRLVEQLGFPSDVGNGVTVAINIGSLFGPLIFGRLADVFGLPGVARYHFLAFALSIILLGLTPAVLPMLYGVALIAGLALGGAMTSLYALAPVIFAGAVRATGTGIAIGMGRLGGALGPALAGWAIAAGVGRVPLHFAFAMPVLLVFVVIALGLGNSAQTQGRGQGELA